MSDIAVPPDVHYAPNVDLNAVPRMILGRRTVVRHGYELSRLGPLRGLGLAYKQLMHMPDAQIGWAIASGQTAARLDRPDIVMSSSPPASAHVAAALFAVRRGIPWVAEYRSPWTDSLYFRRWWPARPIERAAERWIGQRASGVTAISGFLQNTLIRTLGRDVVHIPNGFDPDDYQGDVTIEPGLFVHLGSVYAPYPTETLIKALGRVHRKIRVVFLGRNLANLSDELRSAGADRLIERPGPIRRSEAIQLIRRAEANLIFLTEPTGSSWSTDVPQKMYEYFGARRPILAIGPDGSETAKALTRSGLATFAQTPEAVAQCLENMGPSTPDHDFVESFSYAKIAERFIEVFHKLL